MSDVQEYVRPALREQLLRHGVAQLSDADLLAIFIGSGTRRLSCQDLALSLLRHFGDLRAVLNASRQAFTAIDGLGDVRYTQLQAMKEICRRSDFISLKKEICIHSTEQTFQYLKRQLRDRSREFFAAIFLDNQHRVLAYEELSSGTINAAHIYPRFLLERTLHHQAAALILAHNHPSGISDPSTEDREITKHLRQALSIIDVRLLDHLVIGDNCIFSIEANRSWDCH